MKRNPLQLREELHEKCRDARDDVLATFPDIMGSESVVPIISGNFISKVFSNVNTEDIDVFIYPVVDELELHCKENVLTEKFLEDLSAKFMEVADTRNANPLPQAKKVFTEEDFKALSFPDLSKGEIVKMGDGYVANFTSYKMKNKGTKTGIPNINFILYSSELRESNSTLMAFFGSWEENAKTIVSGFDFKHASWFYSLKKDLTFAEPETMEYAINKELHVNRKFFWSDLKYWSISRMDATSASAIAKQYKRVAHYIYDHGFTIEDKNLAQMLYVIGNRGIIEYDDWVAICKKHNFKV